jgi:hypothetical protein
MCWYLAAIAQPQQLVYPTSLDLCIKTPSNVLLIEEATRRSGSGLAAGYYCTDHANLAEHAPPTSPQVTLFHFLGNATNARELYLSQSRLDRTNQPQEFAAFDTCYQASRTPATWEQKVVLIADVILAV